MTKHLTTKQVAQLLGVSKRRVQAMLRQNKQPPHFPNARMCECGREWFIPEQDALKKGKKSENNY